MQSTRFVLRIESGERQGDQVPLAEGVLQVGRKADCGLVLVDGSVSGKHAELRVQGERVEVVDLGSTNGTRVSGQKIEQAVLSHGDALLFGNVKVSLYDVRMAGEAPAIGAPPPALEAPSADGALGKISAEKVTRSATGSKRPLVLIGLLLVLGGGAYGYLKFIARPEAGGGASRVIPTVPGNLLSDGSFEEGSAAWTAAESAPVAFLAERAFARSGDVGFGVRLEEGAWSLASSPEVTLHARRSLAASGALRAEGSAEGRLGLELSSSSGSLPAFFAWAPAQRAGAFEERALACDVPSGYDRAKLVVLAHGRGSVALDDVSLLEKEPLGHAAKFTEYELLVLGEPGSNAVLLRSGRPLLVGFDLSSLGKDGPSGWSEAQLSAQAGARGFELGFAGAPSEARLAFQALRGDAASGDSAWVATTGPEGYAASGGDFTRAAVTSLLLGSGTELVRLGFERPVSVNASAIPGGMRFELALGGLTKIEIQLSFQEERVGAATLADRARQAERDRELGPALAAWGELLDKFPFERKLVSEASEARARLIQNGLGQVDELRREMERARFFKLPELFRKGGERARSIAAQYRGSEVEREAEKVATQCQMAMTELAFGSNAGLEQRLKGVLEALAGESAPGLTQHVRESVAGGVDSGKKDN